MTVPPDTSDIECILVSGKLVPLFRCPFCTFSNIHEEEITHHIRCHSTKKYKEDPTHAGIDADKINRKTFIVIKNRQQSQSHYTYTRKEDLPDSLWPWIKCVWCDYRDQLPRDLQWHFLEKHKNKLYNLDEFYHLDPFYSLHDIEPSLDKALNFAKKKSRREGQSEIK